MVTTIVLGIISIGILIFVHELGHFTAARANGIRVEVRVSYPSTGRTRKFRLAGYHSADTVKWRGTLPATA